MGDGRPLILFKCGTCGVPVTRPVRLLDEVPDLPSEDGVDLLPEGCCWRDDRPGKSCGRFLVNLRDMVSTRYHPDGRRVSECCGPSGIDGVNTLCANGHEVATESSDCWTGPHHVELEPYTFIIVELAGSAPDAEPGTSGAEGAAGGLKRPRSARGDSAAGVHGV